MSGDDAERRAGAFGSEADAYERGRPGYPRAAIEFCIGKRPLRVLDLGAGTGKLAAELLELGHEVVAVEPLDAMRARIPEPAEALAGSAEDDSARRRERRRRGRGPSVPLVRPRPALPEIVRVLRPGGSLGLMWNLLDDAVALGRGSRATRSTPRTGSA